MKVDVVAHIHAKSGMERALQSVLESFVAPTLKEEGCLRYDLFVDVDDPSKFTFIEEWSSREALATHGKSDHIAAGRAKFPELLAQPPWVQVLVRASKG
jgi:quinol monooxygenase YgiN